MKYFPAFLKLSGRTVVLVGAGDVGRRRAEQLLDCGARLRVIDPSPTEQIRAAARDGRLTLVERPYRSGDLEGADLVLVATDDSQVNRAVWTDARARKAPINVADDPEKCDFIVPALVERGDLTVAISTHGKSPALAARLRRRFSAMLGSELGRYIAVLDGVRQRLKDSSLDFDQKKRVMYRLIDSDLQQLVRESNRPAIERRIENAIGQASSDVEDRESRGRVYIVGAGPGDPGLITVRGLECLRSADVVLHDRLVDPRLLEAVSDHAEVVDVGKRLGEREGLQEFIHDSMVGHARRGKIVCRLKGGDPFVFGRGGEEARALTEAEIPFEIIPGVTSATAAPGAAGIPLTHRGSAHAFMVMTGSRADNAPEEEWNGAASLLAGGGTLVVLMGLAHLPTIVRRLAAAGCDPRTPAAVVSRGTLDDQDVRVGRLADIRDRADGVVSPAAVVFGNVVLERNRLEELHASAMRKGK